MSYSRRDYTCQKIKKKPESCVVTEKKKAASTFWPVAHCTKYDKISVRKTKIIMFCIDAIKRY